ncbi:OmpA-like transmembrane domain protein [Enhygromyxa salina]|uniref:OmpA-like transmembrane domain protein n=2 Tax=Enhygromyxa salina TaxID=215803 RepID=A0A0C1ZQI2_9BACT|nr:OmpA-like transmembrane domain protein [Enhygromyxa salina]
MTMSKLEQLANEFARGSTLAFAGILGMLGMTGCITDTDCGVCDPDKLVLESISGINYANRKVHLLQDGLTTGKYFIDDISACVETDEAKEAPRGAQEWCKLSPLVSWQGLEFVFNNLLDPTSIELVRKDPSNPQLFQVYDWKTQLATIEGPITRFNGDYVEQTGDLPDTMLRSTNLTCIDNLRARGEDYSHEVLDANPTICSGFHDGGSLGMIPLKMQASGTTKSYRGETDTRASSCTAPDSGPDTCCTVCDYELSVNVAKYGVDDNGVRRTPANALTCTPGGNVYEDCDGFITDVNRESETNRYSYAWNGTTDIFRLPLADKIRETHPDDRPTGVEPDGVPCQTDADCDARLGSASGAVCIGTTPGGVTCDAETDDCGDKHCKAEWFATCKDDSANTGGAYCVDKRFKDKGAGACFIATSGFQSCEPPIDPMGTPVCTSWGAGNRLARCDVSAFPDGNLTASECCQTALGAEQDGVGCDPLFQDSVTPIPRFDRDRTLPEEIRDCFCGPADGQHPSCAAQIEKWCTAPHGNLQRHDGSSNAGEYVTRFVTKVGGVVYDPSLKGVLYLPGDRGNEPRSLVESCAELALSPTLVEGLNIQDGWRMHDSAFFENYENFDRGMCSASEYRVEFATTGERIRDKVGNELASDKTTYVFETPEFHVVPGTGFPTDNLRIGACDDFELRLSNKFDLDPQNLKKLQIVQLSRTSGEDLLGEDCSTSLQPECWQEEHVVAGGLSCAGELADVTAENPPCLTVDVSLQREGSVRVLIDNVRFNVQLFNFDTEQPDAVDGFDRTITGRYRMKVPGLENVEHFKDLDLNDPADIAAYEAAFHDVCGMPLITTGGKGYTDFYYDFTVDPPKCKEDPDGDDVQLSCDNAVKHYNPLQEDQDLDGFGDVADLCQLTFGTANMADSDKDGIGNDCDTCRETPDKYFIDAAMVDDPRMWVRNIPFQFDFDQDGIGDVCDNCVTVANCGIFNASTPHTVGVPVPYQDKGVCQTDANSDMIGDSCIDPDTNMPLVDMDNAAGPVGFGPTDDFDQDGINNLDDWCPRQPVEQDLAARTTCTDDADCPNAGSTCALTPALNGSRYCNHVDTDGDQVGDFCDTCPYEPNPMQVTDAGMQIDDEDGDFVGAACETNASCNIRKDPRPYAFMDVAVDGQCCVTSYPGDGEYMQRADGTWDCIGLCDLDGFPITLDCADEAIPGDDLPNGSKCRKLPAALAILPGVVDLAPGCQEALDAAGKCAPQGETDPNCPPEMANGRLTLFDVPNEDELWDKLCFLPQWDQDFDGIGDACDLCPFSYDPFNEPYVDENTGKVWDNIGRFCAGQYSPDNICAAQEPSGEMETGTDTGDETTG